MKEDVLEQLVDDYLQSEGYFTRHNIKFRPRSDHSDFVRNKDSNHSDIDVIGIHPKKTGADRVWVVSCKSWQSGFNVKSKLKELSENRISGGRESWQLFRELMKPKWSEAFINCIEETTGTREFTYVIAVTKIKEDRKLFENYPLFTEALGENPIKLIGLKEIIDHLNKGSTGSGNMVASSEIGRILQLMRAAGIFMKELDEEVESQDKVV